MPLLGLPHLRINYHTFMPLPLDPCTILSVSLVARTYPYFESVAAGFPSPADDYLESPLDLNRYLIQNKAATFFVRVEGLSMRDAGIFPGDLLVVDRSKTPQHRDIVLAYYEGAFTVKRLWREAHTTWLHPENPDFEPLPITFDTDCRIWGVVTYVIHKPMHRHAS